MSLKTLKTLSSHWLIFRGGDVRELKRHIHANSVDRFTLRRFVTAVLGSREPDVKQEYQEVALSVASLVEKLDIPEENIATLLCYLEDFSPPLVNVTNHVYSQVILASHWPRSISCSCSHWLMLFRPVSSAMEDLGNSGRSPPSVLPWQQPSLSSARGVLTSPQPPVLSSQWWRSARGKNSISGWIQSCTFL